MELKKATRKKVKLKMSVSAPTGYGKTVGALLMAYGFTNDWEKIAVIDTENESASLYANHRLSNGFVIGEFQTIPLAPPFTPESYMKAIRLCEEGGIEVIIIDSVTHVWSGQGGLLESNDALGGNKFQNWAKTTPRYQAWLGAILNSKCHIITTARKKQAYSLVEENGKKKVEKLGMEDQIRDGFDYEMTLALELVNDNHLAHASKDRTGLFMNQPEFVITPATGKLIKDWCELGVDAPQPAQPTLPAATEKLLNQALDKINGGDLTILDKMIATFSLTPQQLVVLQTAHDTIKVSKESVQQFEAVTEATN